MLECAICLYVRDEVAEAVTVKGGTAVCADHLGYATDDHVSFAISQGAS